MPLGVFFEREKQFGALLADFARPDDVRVRRTE